MEHMLGMLGCSYCNDILCAFLILALLPISGAMTLKPETDPTEAVYDARLWSTRSFFTYIQCIHKQTTPMNILKEQCQAFHATRRNDIPAIRAQAKEICAKEVAFVKRYAALAVPVRVVWSDQTWQHIRNMHRLRVVVVPPPDNDAQK